MRPLDPLLFLIGNRASIERIASDKRAWITGALLVLSAGVARNYDHLDLLREPEWFIGPFVASLVSILFIFACLQRPLRLKAAGALRPQLVTFLTLAWLTAPCAWLYGIPVESMTDIVTATQWNIAFLAVVSLWRVALMTRSVAVLTGVSWHRALPLVLGPAAFEAMLGSFYKGISLVQIMGGVRLPPHNRLLKDASDFTTVASFWIFLACVLAAVVTKGTAKGSLARPPARSHPVSFAIAGIALTAWLVASLPSQSRVRNRNHLEQLIFAGHHGEAIHFATSKTRGDFPSFRPLPPEPGYRFPWEFLDEIPAKTPAWLKNEWTGTAVDAAKQKNSLTPSEIQELRRLEPRIDDILREYADFLRSDPRIERLDSKWLKNYDDIAQPNP